MSPFSFVPEGCIAYILSFTCPKDACRAAAVSPRFKSAAESDTVWDRFLPIHYQEMISDSNSPVIFPTKKKLYLFLCDSGLLLDGGKLSFRLIKSSGKKCYMLCARELQIAWKDTPRYWKWASLPESRFAEVAELLSVFWLDISGIFPTQLLSPNTNYAAYLVFKLSDGHYGLDVTSNSSVRRVEETTREAAERNARTAYIVPRTLRGQRGRRGRRDPLPARRRDGWMEMELGEFFVAQGDEFDVEARLFEIKLGNAKRGLIVEGIEVRPMEVI